MKNIIIVNGPNLNLLGKRQPEIYGHNDFDNFLIDLKTKFQDINITYFQSNIEGEIIDKLHEVVFDICTSITGESIDATASPIPTDV